MHKQKMALSWSGGKDCMLALHELLIAENVELAYLFSTISQETNQVSMHGLNKEILIRQVEALGLPLLFVKMPEMPTNAVYHQMMRDVYLRFKNENLQHIAYGDLFLEDLKTFRENQLRKYALKAIFPLWKRNTTTTINQFIDLGYKAIVISAQDDLKAFCGRVINRQFLDDLPSHIDPCGENGEFHTFVFDGPLFSKPIAFEISAIYSKSYPSPSKINEECAYWFVDIETTDYL